jgi:predicted adenylyl cyclase CyaB
MAINIIEFKARVIDPENIERILQTKKPVFAGQDRQIDTYFNVSDGRLKLREGSIESALIWYDRPNDAGCKQSQVLLHKYESSSGLKEILIKLHGIKVVVDKKRRIYFIDNVKFHFDEVEGLGKFIEVEAIDNSGELGLGKIQEQCDFYANLFEIKPSEYIAVSYSDLLLKK